MVHCVVVMDEYLKMVKKDIGIAHLSEDMIEEGLKVRDDSHENKRTDIKEQEQHSSRVHTARISVGACVAGGVHVRGWHASRGLACMAGEGACDRVVPRGMRGRDTHPLSLWTESQTGVKTLPFHHFVCRR